MVRKVSTSTMRDGSFPFGNGTGKPTLVRGHLPLKFQWITHTKRLRGVGASEGFAPGRVVWICTLWALIHSVLASKQVKDLTRRIAGPRYRDGLYRFTFNAQSVVLLLWAARRFSRLPDQELYRVRPPWSWFF